MGDDIELEWDEAKRQQTLKERDLDFQLARYVLADPHLVRYKINRRSTMGRIVRMTAAEIDKELTPEKIRAMLKKAKYSEDDNPFTPEEWWAKAERPNLGRPPKKVVKQDIHIRLDPFTLKKLKALGRGWQTKLSAKVDEWVSTGLL